MNYIKAFLFLFVALAIPAFGQQSPPNVVIILTDDQGYADVGFNGSTEIPTPNIDRIAKNGTVFTNGYVSFAVCGPSRAGLITGRYQDRFGFSRNPLMAPKDSTMGLPQSEETMAELLKKAGYRTGVLGKWHLGAHPSQRPNQRGFDEFYGFLSGGHRYFSEEYTFQDLSEISAQFDAYRTKLLRNEERVEETEYLTDALSREAVSFVERNQNQPFFLYLAYNAPHAPMQAIPKYLDRFPTIPDPKRRTYAAMVSAVDDGVGDLLDKIEELGLTENTLIFFLSDNGGPTKDNASSNAPLRGFKGDFFEGGIRVPFAVQWKGKIPSGASYEYPVISLDIFATAAALASVNPKNELDGVNLIPYLTGKNSGRPHEALYWRNYDAKRFAIRHLDQKLITLPDRVFQFDLDSDWSEKLNLEQKNLSLSERLRGLIETWNETLELPRFLGLLQDKEYSRLNPDRFKKKK
ncbi:sulfatase-like hydrolase/transferase [Algoriphagus sp.]|uniref:sulfatase-like hydrolase/transferase n=1 Tax=Algoriphagus sp. TaxID=1872435 RepID=UPI0026322D30|nr:sulfatase-like hydrolase/transferase [Algoriphagus sp.]